ncbi:unnamed protein product [Paramecium octaurelia]|uniref:Uncharacterized protein n=1 Tax=Paramecium octaurelia TaxID=43137 RepID=A0A8S1XE60_PAROT|nr:unnamed protein product [Paramecium octaurelia]
MQCKSNHYFDPDEIRRSNLSKSANGIYVEIVLMNALHVRKMNLMNWFANLVKNITICQMDSVKRVVNIVKFVRFILMIIMDKSIQDAQSDDLTINTLDINYKPQFDKSQFRTLSARCIDLYIFVFETKECKDTTNSDCLFGIGQLNQKINLQNQYCDQNSLNLKLNFDEIVQFTEKCSNYNQNCQICLQTDLNGYYSCLDCLNGYYPSIISGKCSNCPPDLKCKSCYSQRSVLKDGWKIQVRAFYRKYIEINIFHQFTTYGQSQNPDEYEIICSSCIYGQRLHNNKCIEYCSETCIKCVLQNDKYLCSKCQSDQRGRKLTIINNQCIEAQTKEEIQMINPVFSNLKYLKYIYQCLKSYGDLTYYYDDDFGLFIVCKQMDQDYGCQNQLIISLNFYSLYEDYFNDYYQLQDDESKIKFRKENIVLSTVVSSTTSFAEYENDQFYTLANSKFFKSIIIKISSKRQIRGFMYGGGNINKYSKRTYLPQKMLKLNLYSKKKQVYFLNQTCISLIFQKSLYNVFCYKLLLLQNLYLTVLFHNQQFYKILDFNLTILLIIILIDCEYCQIHYRKKHLILLKLKIPLILKPQFFKIYHYFNALFINYFQIQDQAITIMFKQILQKFILNFSNSTLILVSQKNTGGQLKLSNVELQGKIFHSIYFFNFEQVFQLEIINFSLLDPLLDNTTFIILNRNSFLENIKFTANQFLQQSQ